MFAPSVAIVNAVLTLHADAPLPLAQIARSAGVSYAVAQSAVATLEKRGLVTREMRSGRDEFAPDRQSPYYPMAYGAALVDLPIDKALKGHRIQAVYAYGSLASPGGGSRQSDLDLLIVGDVRDREELVVRLSEVGQRLGRAIDPLILTPEEVDAGLARNDSHVAAAIGGIRLRGSV